MRRRLRGFVVTADAENAPRRANVGDKVRPVEWADLKRLLRPVNGASRIDCSVNSFFPLGKSVSTLRSNSKETVSFAAPFRHTAFAVIWTATLVSNVGGWMYSAASGWLMTGLNPDPLIVASVQAASSLPICLFAIPAGALADIFDKRKYLIAVESLFTVLAIAYAILVGLNLATPINLLVFTFVLGAAGALTSPAWQAVVPQLGVPAPMPRSPSSGWDPGSISANPRKTHPRQRRRRWRRAALHRGWDRRQSAPGQRAEAAPRTVAHGLGHRHKRLFEIENILKCSVCNQQVKH